MTHRSSSRVLLVVAAFMLFLVPVAAIAAGEFTDVDDDNLFKTDIEWMADAGVTKGCNPPTNDEFCPGDNVTREQMSAFMHRLAVNKVVDAKSALDADNLDGMDSTAFALAGHDHDTDYLAVDGKADDADLLDGMDSTAFVQKGESNSVSSSMMTDSPGIAQATEGSAVLLTSNMANVLSVEVEAPAAGYVLVQSTFVSVVVHTNGAADLCQFDVSAIDATLPTDIRPAINVPSNAPSGEYTFMPAVSRVYPVGSAGTHTFYLVGQEVESICYVDEIALTALYVPVAYGALAGTP